MDTSDGLVAVHIPLKLFNEVREKIVKGEPGKYTSVDDLVSKLVALEVGESKRIGSAEELSTEDTMVIDERLGRLGYF